MSHGDVLMGGNRLCPHRKLVPAEICFECNKEHAKEAAERRRKVLELAEQKKAAIEEIEKAGLPNLARYLAAIEEFRT